MNGDIKNDLIDNLPFKFSNAHLRNYKEKEKEKKKTDILNDRSVNVKRESHIYANTKTDEKKKKKNGKKKTYKNVEKENNITEKRNFYFVNKKRDNKKNDLLQWKKKSLIFCEDTLEEEKVKSCFHMKKGEYKHNVKCGYNDSNNEERYADDDNDLCVQLKRCLDSDKGVEKKTENKNFKDKKSENRQCYDLNDFEKVKYSYGTSSLEDDMHETNFSIEEGDTTIFGESLFSSFNLGNHPFGRWKWKESHEGRGNRVTIHHDEKTEQKGEEKKKKKKEKKKEKEKEMEKEKEKKNYDCSQTDVDIDILGKSHSSEDMPIENDEIDLSLFPKESKELRISHLSREGKKDPKDEITCVQNRYMFQGGEYSGRSTCDEGDKELNLFHSLKDIYHNHSKKMKLIDYNKILNRSLYKKTLQDAESGHKKKKTETYKNRKGKPNADAKEIIRNIKRRLGFDSDEESTGTLSRRQHEGKEATLKFVGGNTRYKLDDMQKGTPHFCDSLNYSADDPASDQSCTCPVKGEPTDVAGIADGLVEDNMYTTSDRGLTNFQNFVSDDFNLTGDQNVSFHASMFGEKREDDMEKGGSFSNQEDEEDDMFSLSTSSAKFKQSFLRAVRRPEEVIEEEAMKDVMNVMQEEAVKDVMSVMREEAAKNVMSVMQEEAAKNVMSVMREEAAKNVMSVMQEEAAKNVMSVMQEEAAKNVMSVMQEEAAKDAKKATAEGTCSVDREALKSGQHTKEWSKSRVLLEEDAKKGKPSKENVEGEKAKIPTCICKDIEIYKIKNIIERAKGNGENTNVWNSVQYKHFLTQLNSFISKSNFERGSYIFSLDDDIRVEEFSQKMDLYMQNIFNNQIRYLNNLLMEIFS
ncbi:conserved Plasmodium protein, unknown function [Plasmodium ovale curtisi]|uniref:Uncharacterized protein n=1 Tax=Plasmodium ovale curtisi TaxID=864141 RepID=A0A1A8WP38_PLAOA|nr:conserved Plasmodium protein, unknown function [Plasmodium ovale curtisi]